MKKALYILSLMLLTFSCTPVKEETSPSKEEPGEQKEESRIVISDKSLSIGFQGGEVEVKVTSNVEVKVVLPGNTPWISQGETKAQMTETVYSFIIQANPETSAREASITFVNEAEKLSETVTVKQDGKEPEEQLYSPGVYGVAGLNYVYEKGRHQYLVRKEGSMKKFVIVDPAAQQFLSVRMEYSNKPGKKVTASILQNVSEDRPSLQELISLKVVKVENGLTVFSSVEDESKKLVLKYTEE